nr:hypothetical protein [Candidatus Bathyarchaeota archaeon]
MSPLANRSFLASLFDDILRVVKVKVDKKLFVLAASVALIALLAFLIRLFPFFLYPPYIAAYDPWIQYYNTVFITTYGYGAWFGWYDRMRWYPYGQDISRSYLPGVPFTAATLYFLLKALGVNLDVYMVCYVLPAVMGAASCVAMFFLGREVLDEKAGLIASFLLSFTPGFIERTIAGFFDNECVGLFFFILTTFFFIRSLKRKSVFSAVMAGLSLGGFIASWGAAIYMLYVLPLAVILLILLKRYSSNLLIGYSITVTLGLFVATRVPEYDAGYLVSGSALPAIIGLLILVLYEVYPRVKPAIRSIPEKIAKYPQIHNLIKTRRNAALTLAAVTVSLLACVMLLLYSNPILSLALSYKLSSFLSISGRYLSVANPFYREEEVIIASVAEHASTAWGMFFYDLHVTVILFPVGMYFAFQRRRDEDLMLLILGVTTVYFAGSMIRLVLLFAPVACLMSGFALAMIYDPLSRVLLGEEKIAIKRRRAIVRKILGKESAFAVFAITGILLFFAFHHGVTATVFSGSPQMAPRDSYGNFYLDWEEAFAFMQNELPPNAIIVSWWDYGYWITVRGNKTTVVDNATFNTTQIALVGRALTSTNETESLEILRQFNATHVLVYFGHNDANLHGDEGKWIWMAKISFNVFYTPWEYEYYAPTPTGVKYLPSFFNMTLYKLLYYHDPNPENPSQNALEYRLYSYMQDNGYPLVIGYNEVGNPPGWYPNWQHGFSVLKHFKPVFISSNHLVKIFEIDYSILDANMSVESVSIDASGNGVARIVNNGKVAFNVTGIYLNGTACDFSGVTIQPGESVELSFKASGLTLNSGDKVPLKIVASIPDLEREMEVTVS